MAESEQYSRSVLGASDEIHDIYCEPCHKVGSVVIAEGYCVDCPEYLCGPCYKIHRRHKALANHVLLDKDSMPLTAVSSRRVVDVWETKCPIHPSKVIELFCETCDKLVCTICVATVHRQCEEVKHIPDIIKDLEHTKEFKKFNEDIQSAANALSEVEERLQTNVTFIDEMRKLAKQEQKHWRAKVNRIFDEAEKKMDEQITALEKRNKETLKAVSDRLNQMKKYFDKIKTDIEAKNTGQRCELFIAMKRSDEEMKTFQDQFDKIQEKLRIQHYKLVPSEQILTLMRKTTEIFRMETTRFESQIDTKTSTDKEDPRICDLNIMHGHYCIALENENKSIKVIDTKSKCLSSKINIEAECIRSVTPVCDDQVAVLVSLSRGKHQIQFFIVSASGVLQRTNKLYDVDHCYSGMVHCQGNIYGVRYDRIDKLDMTGKIIRAIHTDDKGWMERIAISPDGQTLYVTDSRENSVTSMTLDGEITAVYKDKNLIGPWGITVDKYGYVFVCSRDTRNIQQFTADLQKVQVLKGDFDNCVATYSSTENKLYISFLNLIHPYSLDFKLISNNIDE